MISASRGKDYATTGLSRSNAEIHYILDRQEVLRVITANLLEYGAANKQTGS